MDTDAGRERTIMGLLPREGKFFDPFEQHADSAVGAGVELQALPADLLPPDIRSRAIQRSERQADRITREIISCAAFISALGWWLGWHVP